MAKLSKAQQGVIDHAKAHIDFARTYSFYDWYRKGFRWSENATDAEIDEFINNEDWSSGREYYTTRYEWEREGIDYLCQASGPH